MNHLLERFRDGRIAVSDFTELKHWLESDVEVLEGMWFKLSEIHARRRRRIAEDLSCSGNDAKRNRGLPVALALEAAGAFPRLAFSPLGLPE
jgi:hypothetical protein